MSDDPSSKNAVIAIGAVGGLLAAILVPLLVIVAVQPPPLNCGGSSGAAVAELTAEQADNARLIISEVQAAGLPRRAAVVAIATAYQESTLRNLTYGDDAGPDSRGLFQQLLRYYPDAQDPHKATRTFLTGLVALAGWETMGLADIVAAVQRPAHPELYPAREPLAETIVSQLWTGPTAGCGSGTGPVFILGDSITVRATPAITTALAGRQVTIDAAVGRTLTEGLKDLAGRANDIVGATVVVALCTNYGGDQNTFATQIDQAMTALAAAAAVEWVTCTEWSPSQPLANTAIRQAKDRWPTITVAEWAGPSAGPGMLDPDGVHPVIGAGTTAWADIVAASLPQTGPTTTGGYALPVDLHWYQEHPGWFTKPHHDGGPASDIPVPEGTPIYAATAGTVVSSPTGGNCGQGLVIDGDDGNRYTYCHGIRPLIPAGVHVQAADPIMISGNTGRSDGAHLHFQIADSSGQGRCPQLALTAWATGRVIDVDSLPTSRCG